MISVSRYYSPDVRICKRECDKIRYMQKRITICTTHRGIKQPNWLSRAMYR